MPHVLSEAERHALITQLGESLETFEQSIASVPLSLWFAAPPSGGWSPGEIAEHVLLTETRLVTLMREKLMNFPERIPDEAALRLDAIIPARIIRRTGRRLESPESLRPARRFPDPLTLLEAFREQRRETIRYAATTEDSLRTHTMPHPGFGELDGYQWLLFLSAHSTRHTLQIEETLSALTAARASASG